MVDTTSPSIEDILSPEYVTSSLKVAIIDRSDAGRLRVRGKDAIDLLNRLSTNNLDDLQPDVGLGTVLTTHKGRIKDLLFIIPTVETLLILTGPERQQDVIDWIEFYTFTEDVTVENVTDETALFSIMGPDAPSFVHQVLDVNITQTQNFSSLITKKLPESILVQSNYFDVPTFDLIVDVESKKYALSLFRESGVKLASKDSAENIRITMGVPSAAGELTEDYNPLEAGLRKYISFNKNCYIGQEVISRLNAYGKVQRHLTKLELKNQDVMPKPGTDLKVDGSTIGHITSVEKISSDKSTGIALGYVKKSHIENGTQLVAETTDGTVSLTVIGLSGGL